MDDNHTPLDTPRSHDDSMPRQLDGTAPRNAREAYDSLDARLDAARAWEVTNYLGGCPMCARTDGYLNLGRTHIFVCHTHKTWWHGGSNLFSDWRGETEEDWARNEALLAAYTEVEPLDNPLECSYDDACRRCGAAHDMAMHHPLCQHADGTPTALQDSVVYILLEVGAPREVMKALIRRALHSGPVAVIPQIRCVSIPKATSEGHSA